jgi:pentatricopeptide repeat protein
MAAFVIATHLQSSTLSHQIYFTETEDGYVTIMGISDKAAPVVKKNLRVGDRVVSVESSVGAQMWDVYSVDGLTSAVTSRLPGQPVRILFERISEADRIAATVVQPPAAPAASIISNPVVGFRQAGKSAVVPALVSSSTATQMQRKMLLSRSRDLLRTYIARNEVTKNVKVADRVLEAVMDATAILDGKTLNLIMKAYNTCNDAAKAIEIFEEVFGLAGDGSERKVESIYGGKLLADITALNIFNISALLHAHAIRGDYESAIRVIAALEGKTDFSIKGIKSRSWSGLGDPLTMLPDTQMYNIALAAAAKRGTMEGLLAASEIFDSMPNPSLNIPPFGKPAKNLVTFNTMIDAFANAGQYQNAFDVFQSLKKSSLRPDKVSFTSLIKASIKSGDLEKAKDLLDDMKWIGIQPDLVTYNNIIESLCKANRLFEAKDLVNEMERARVSPDSMTYGLLMNGLLKAKKPGPCLTLFESAYADERTAALTENVKLYTTAISAAAALGDHERALELVSRMNLAGVKPNKKTLTALMGACIAGRNYGTAVKIFYTIKNPDSYAISAGLRALCLMGKFDAALELITDHRSGQNVLSGKQVLTGYNNLLQEALSSGEFNIAREALVSPHFEISSQTILIMLSNKLF